jgi:N12 class adenine-specific DNA methylase
MTLTHERPVTGPARFRPQGQDDLAPSGAASRVAANLAALRTLRVLQAQDRPATPEEQAVLARWSGWGAVPQVFDDDRDEFAAARAELRQLLPEPEYSAARRTTINAHYTDVALAKVVWDAVTVLGFDGGQVLEPGCGSGNFIGLAPPGAQVLGVELDPVTAGVAARLYPDAEIRCESFADTRLPEGQFDLVIGNVPFSSARLHDRRHNPAGHSMHNHFIIKSLTFLKPGGLLAVLTSRYTMDAQDPSAREEMAGLAGLVTAVRLPSGAHRRAAGTEAVTDLLVLRRTDPGAPGPRPQWRRAFETSLDGGTAWINEYWRDHPENVLGSFTVGRGQYNDHDLSVRPSGDLSGVASQLAIRLAVRPVTVAPQAVPAGETDRFDGTLRANDDGSFSVLRDGLWQSWPCPATQAGELRDLLGLRDTVAALLDAEASSPEDTPAITGLRVELNRRYDAYAAAYGPVNRTGWKRTGKTDEEGHDVLARHRPPQGKFSEDPYAAAVYALEDFDPETGQAAKTVIFTKRVITTRQPPERASDPADAAAICMDIAGEIRLEDAARLLGSASAGEARTALGELVYDEPGTGRLVPAAEYLSGKVRAKLRDAEQAAGDDPRFEVNVAALRRALPPDLGPGEIDARLGASWIDPRYVQQGLREILEDPALTVEKGHGTAWTVTGSKTSVLATQVWGTEEKDAVSLAACLLEQRPVKVSPERSERDDTARDKHQKRLQAAAATITARAKADELNRRFGEWLWEHPERTADLVRTYNERFNSLVLRSYDGARPALPGLASWFREWVHPHQLAAVARIVNEPAVLLAHDVGAGKTAEMTMGAMELRRLGLAAKPGLVVPNHMLEQFQREFLQLYPQARVLAAGNDDLRTHGRHTFVARIATGNWDAVIMSQSVFERIPMSAPEIERYISAQLADYTAWLERAREARQSKRMIKKMETRMLMREQRLRKKLDRARDGGICWEQTGIDYLFIDEAHQHKNLDTRSNNQELDIDGSGRASDLEMKLDYLRAAHGRRVVTFATATPIANSMTEAYVMSRYLRPDLLADAGIEDFDAWVGTFAETTTDVEVAPEGGIRVKDRFARFRNIPELLNMWRVAADVKTKEDLKLPIPELAGGKPEVIPVEPSGQLLGFMQNLASRAEAVRSHAVLPDEDNMLKISSDGRLAALDPRLAGLAAPETGKLDVAAQTIARIEHEHRDDTYHDAGGNLLPVTGSLQIVFCDLGTPGGKSRWNAYEYLRGKLAGYGVDPRTVRFMHEAKTDKAKAELFAAARAGKVAVLLGSTSLMGVGTNVQDIAIALHHLDCPWRPADVAQREGRILRQRNKHSQVQIYRYVTERSFDAYMWQTVTRKAKFIDQVIHGKTTGRDAEDIGGDMAALSFSEVTALATGDMRILVKAKADSEVQRLERLESAWRRTRQHLKTTIGDSAQSAARLTDVAAQLDSALERRVDTRADAFTMRLDGQAFSKRTDAAACLRNILHTQLSQAKKGTRPRDDHGDIGTLGGFTIICTPTWGSGNQVWAHLRFDGVPVPAVRISETELDLAPGKPPVGLITRLENKLADLGTDRDKVLREISRIQAEAERARTAASAPFAHADELARARAQSDRLAEELSGEPSAPPPVPAAAETPDAGEAAPDPAAHTAAADSDPGQHASAASPPADDPGTRAGSTSTAQRAQATAVPAPPGPAEAATPAHQPAAASPPVPAPAPVGTSSRADQAAVPEAAPAPSAHDPSHPADQDQPAAGDPAGGLVIEHHQQGTLIHGTQQNDHQLRRILHNHGFRWSGNLNAWYLPRPWTFSTRNRRVSNLTTDLRQTHRSFTMRTQPPAPGNTDYSPPEPLPAADPYTDIRHARSDHTRAISDYWALTRTPAGNNIMSTYPESGARPDALTLNAAYKALSVSWEETFAGHPQEVAGRLTAWAQAASALSRNLAAEQHRAPKFRQTLDTFIGSATRLASRTQATAEDPAAWARVFASLPAAAPDADPTLKTGIPDPAQPTASSPDHELPSAEDEQPRQHSRGDEHPASPAGRQQAASKSRQAKAALDSGDFEQALVLLDEAELLYPGHGISYGAARDQVRSAVNQAGPGHPQEADAGQQQRGVGTAGRQARHTASPALGEHALDEHHAAGPPDRTQPLAAHTGWAGNLRPERLLYADGTPLRIRGQGDDNDQVLPATAVGAVPAPGDSEYGSGRLQVVRWTDGQHAIIHPALASPAGIDAYAGLSDRDRARWEAFDLAEAWPATTAGLPPHLVDVGDVLQVERGLRSRTMDLREVQSVQPGTGTLASGLEFKVTGIRSRLFYPPNSHVPVCIPEEHPSLPAAIQAALPAAPDSPQTADPAPDLSPSARAADDTATRDTAGATPQPAPAASAPSAGSQPGTAPKAAATAEIGTRPAPDEPVGSGKPEPGASPLTNSDLATELRRLPGFAQWLSQAGMPPAEGDQASHPGTGSPAASDTRGIEITVTGPGFTRRGLVTWPQAASWIDAGVTPARLGIVIIADRLRTFCRTHRHQLIAAGTCDPDATAAELGQIRDNAVAMIVDAALRSRGAVAPVPPARPGDPAWYTAVMITRPDRAVGKAENAALERLTRLRTTIREPQPATEAEIRATIRRRTGYGLPDLVRALDDPAAMRAWITDQASRPGEGGYDSSGERWYGASPDGLITDRSGDDRAASLIRWEEIPAWIQPGITSSLRDRLLAAAGASSAAFRRRLTAAVHPDAGLTTPSAEKDKQAIQRRTEAADAAWAAIEAAPPPSPADLDHARHVYRDMSPVQQSLFDDPPQDSMPVQDGTRATASRPPRPAPSGPAAPAGAGRPAAKAAAPQPEPARQQDPPGHRVGPRHSPASEPAAPPGEHHPDADDPDPGASPDDQPAAPPSDAAAPRAAGTRGQNPGTIDPGVAGSAHNDDLEPPQTPATNSDLAIALHYMSGQELTSFLTLGDTPAHGSRGWRREGLPDAGASEDLDFERSGVRITVRSRGFHRHGQMSWRQVASWIDTGLTPARLGIIIAASRLHIYTYARRDELIAVGKDNIDAAIRELNQISIDAIDAALGAALSTRDADAPVPPARPGKPAYSTTAMLTQPDPVASAEENTALARIAELEAAIRGTQPVTPADIRTAIRWWIGDSLPEYARALASPEAMRAWIRRQASGPASRPGHGTYDNGRYYGASPEGLRTSQGSDTRTAPWILWEDIPAWIQPGLSASLRDRLAAAKPRPAPGRTPTAAGRPPAGAADPAGQADDPLPGPLREAINAAWAAIEAAPPPSPGDMDHARTSYRATGTVQQALPSNPAKTRQLGRAVAPAPRPRAEPRPAQPPAPAQAAHRQDELPAAAAAGRSAGTATRPRREPAAPPQPTATSDPLTDDDIFIGISRLPAFVIGDLFHASDTGQPLESVSRQLTPYSGERAADEPDPGAREAVTAEPTGLRIQVAPAGSRRTGLITWRQIDDLLRPGMTPARRQIVAQARQVRVGFIAAHASFRAVGEGRLAAAAEDELRAQAAAAVTAILAAAHPAAAGQAPQSADEDAMVKRIADLAAALPSEPPRSHTPAGQVTTGDIIGHPGYSFQPFRVAAPPRHTDATVEITGRLIEPTGTEPAGPITFTLPRAGQPGPVVSVIPVPARSLRPLFPGHDAAADTGQPADARPDRAGRTPAETAGTPSDAVPAPDAETPTRQPHAPQTHSQEETMPPAADSTAPSESPASAQPSAAPQTPTAAPAPAPPEIGGQEDTGRDSPRSYPAARPGDGTSLSNELERALDAIRQRRGAAADGHASDDFSDIRSAFAAMRDALGLSAASPEAAPGQPAPAPAPAAAASRPARGEPAPAADDFTDIQAAFADLRDILELPARGRHARGGGPPDRTHTSVADVLDHAAAEAQACARWYRDTPEWQRISTVGRAARDLITAIREAAGDYWAEIRLDIRVRGFARTLAARTALAVSGAAHVLAGRLEQAGHRDSRIWRAAWRLHQASTTFANRVMRYTPPGSPDRMREARRIIDDLGQRQDRPGQPGSGRHAAPRSAGGTRTPNAAALASASFPVMVTRANARQATVAPAARTAVPAPRQPAARRQ